MKRLILLLVTPVAYLCSQAQIEQQVERKVDDFTGEISLSSPVLQPMVIYKDIKKNKATYYLRLTAFGSTVVVDGVGATVLFTDGTKWSKNEKIGVEPSELGYDYRAFMSISQADVTAFSTKTIKKYRLYIFDRVIDSSEAEKFKMIVKYIKDAK